MVLTLVARVVAVRSVVHLTADVVQVVRRRYFLLSSVSVRESVHSPGRGCPVTWHALAVLTFGVAGWVRATGVTIAERLVCHVISTNSF